MAKFLEAFDGIIVWQDMRVETLAGPANSLARQARREALRSVPYCRLTADDFDMADCLEEIDGVPVWPRPATRFPALAP